MNTDEYLVYKRFSDKERAEYIISLLKENGIPSLQNESSSKLDTLFMPRDNRDKEYIVEIKGTDFERADQIIRQTESEQLNSVDKDYYLYDFTDDELVDVVIHSYEWSEFDALLAQKLLKEKGKGISETEIKRLKDYRIEQLSKPKEVSFFWIVTGYIFALLGGVLGIAIGANFYYHKKTIPNGQLVPVYTPTVRKHGYNIFILGIIIAVLSLVLILMQDLNAVF